MFALVVVVGMLSGAAPAAATCADDWDGLAIRLTGQIGDIVEDSSGWTMPTDMQAAPGCEIAEIYGEIEIPAACLPGRIFEVLGFFQYRDDDQHFELWRQDLLAFHAARLNCL